MSRRRGPRPSRAQARWPRQRRYAAGLTAALLLLLWWSSTGPKDPDDATWPRRDLLNALRWVESRNRPDDQIPDGDDGLAIGPYQIHRAYWRDAYEQDAALGGSYQDCRRRSYAERVIDAYMRRYAPEAWRLGRGERIARVHNGGPEGHQKRATYAYWRRVRARLPAPQPQRR